MKDDKLINHYEGDPNIVFINGDLLHSKGSWEKICNFLAITNYDFKFRDMRRNIWIDCDHELHKKCKNLHNKLIKISI